MTTNDAEMRAEFRDYWNNKQRGREGAWTMAEYRGAHDAWQAATRRAGAREAAIESAARNVLAAYDAAWEGTSYDELFVEAFENAGGMEPLRSVLAAAAPEEKGAAE